MLLCLETSAQSPSAIDAYIQRFKQIALEQERMYGVPAPITLAQGLLESGAGMSRLTREANNHFGIKAGSKWRGKVYRAWDDEAVKSRFRCYASAEESYKDHALLLKEGSYYRSLFTKSIYDYRGWALGLQKAGYATSPTYAKALIGYIDAYRLYAINGGVKLRPGKTVTIRRSITKEEIASQKDIKMEETEKSEEQESLEQTMMKYVVEINGVRCTILYPGETLSSVAMKYDIPKHVLLNFNETTSERDIVEGDVVFLEKKKKKYDGPVGIFRAKGGETMIEVAQRYGIRLESLTKMNGRGSFDILKEGEKLKLR